jgi:hypothetical protein
MEDALERVLGGQRSKQLEYVDVAKKLEQVGLAALFDAEDWPPSMAVSARC